MNPSVSLYIRTTKNGTRTCELAHERKQADDGIYCLRYEHNGKRRWKSLGKWLNSAKTERSEVELALLGHKVVVGESLFTGVPVTPKQKLKLSELHEKFIVAKKSQRRRDGSLLDRETVSAYEQHTERFLSILEECGHQYPEQVDGDDLRQYMAALHEEDYAQDSVCNHYTNVATFLRFCKVDHKELLPQMERPVSSELEPEAYEEEEVEKFMAAVDTERDQLAFEFLLKCGAREREMTHIEPKDFKFGSSPAVTFQNKIHLSFRTKTGKKRTVPLERSLAVKLENWIRRNPAKKLVFGTDKDRPDHHYWRKCKKYAVKAELDPDKFWIHKWRDTFATWALRKRPDLLRAVSGWLGHSSVQMTEKYLAPGSGKYAQDGIHNAFGKRPISERKVALDYRDPPASRQSPVSTLIVSLSRFSFLHSTRPPAAFSLSKILVTSPLRSLVFCSSVLLRRNV